MVVGVESGLVLMGLSGDELVGGAVGVGWAGLSLELEAGSSHCNAFPAALTARAGPSF